jgi:hypothetical protein
MSVLLYPSCPTDCAGSLPDPLFNDCTPVDGFGEIRYIYLAKANADDLTNVEDLAEWTTKLALAVSDPNAIRKFTVLGDMPAPEKTEIQRSGDRTVTGLKRFQVIFEIDDDSDPNYEAHLLFECSTKFKMWYETADGMLFGGNEGVLPSISSDYIIPRASGELRKIMGVAKWTSKRSPLRCISPMA